MNLADLLKEFNVVIDTAEGLTELRSLILGLAVRGKLVPQDPNDEPASELLKKIETEKERLYEEGEIRKPKNLSSIKKSDELFSIPKNWLWIRLGEITELPYGKNLPTKDLLDEGYDVFGANGIIGKYDSYHFDKPKLLISCRGAYSGKTNISPPKCFVTNNSIVVDFFDISKSSYKYFYYCISALPKENLISGSAQPQVTATNGYKFQVPLPPLAEQNRIVQKIESLFAEVDELEAKLNRQTKLDEKLQLAVNAEVQQAPDAKASTSAWNFITTHFDTLYHTPEAIDNLKKNILNEAVRGRLVPQNPKDEPAAELLQKIEAEKERLYEEGEIRKPKKVKPVSKEDEPFEIPNEWMWCRLGNICDFITSGSTPKKDKFVEEGIPFLKVYNIRDQKIDFDYKPQFIKEDVHNGRLDRSKLYPGNVIMNIVGPPLGKVAIIPDTYPEWNCNQAIVVFRPFVEAINEYLYQFLRAQTFHSGIDLIGTAGQDNISVTKSNNIAFPLPPLEEQHRIVQRIEELFAICDRFKAQLQQRQAVNERLVKGLVGEVLEGE